MRTSSVKPLKHSEEREDPQTIVNVNEQLTQQKIDNLIRTILRSEGWHVEEIASSALDDPEMMKHHFRSLAKALKYDYKK